jgi:hypothetical protein
MQLGRYGIWACLTVFLSAFLLFQVQPIIGNTILPWFGGSASVWNTCMLFFQTLLVAGYAYAHWLGRSWPIHRQAIVHFAVVSVAMLTLPIIPRQSWAPVDGHMPIIRILILLLCVVGPTYFALAATAPLIQLWFSKQHPNASPYRLYALSNLGSLAALFSYPFFVERWLSTQSQGLVWSIGFGFYGLLCVASAAILYQNHTANEADANEADVVDADAELANNEGCDVASLKTALPELRIRAMWIAYPALASIFLLASTAHICQDIAVVPFLWIAPLAVYLITFIYCFDRPQWYKPQVFSVGALAILAYLSLMGAPDLVDQTLFEAGSWLSAITGGKNLFVDFGFEEYSEQLGVQIVVGLLALFMMCMVCHGEVIRTRPASRYLTSFYLSISIGGAIGGILTVIVCPLVFNAHAEYHLCIVIGYILSACVLASHLPWPQARWQWGIHVSILVVLVLGLSAVTTTQNRDYNRKGFAFYRNFYGSVRVTKENYEEEYFEIYGKAHVLMHGRITHGQQMMDSEFSATPTTYYSVTSGVGKTMSTYSAKPRRVAVIGLGTGTMAAYGRGVDHYDFFEINPQMVEIAQRHFKFLAESEAKTEIILGDARLQMERLGDDVKYDIIVVDAFSGDAIPAHLMTLEAMRVYDKHLKPGGVIAFHVSNLYLDLTQIVVRLCDETEFSGVQVFDYVNEDTDYIIFNSDWVLVSRDDDLLDVLRLFHGVDEFEKDPKDCPLWTDQYHNLFDVMN